MHLNVDERYLQFFYSFITRFSQYEILNGVSYRRLFAVLMMPTSTTQEKKEKIRDLEALNRWYANALSPNEGFAGTLKPDYVGFHHNSYYASAYTPHALHKAGLIQYLLSGTIICFKYEPFTYYTDLFSLSLHNVS